jgi:hypothetical protein
MKRLNKIFKRKQKCVAMALCILLGCFSCKKHLLIDITGEPDKVIQDASGKLYYHKKLKMWYVEHAVPGSIDSADCYLITNLPSTFKEGKSVSISGLCYYIPHNLYPHVYYGQTAGVNFFYIKVTNIK